MKRILAALLMLLGASCIVCGCIARGARVAVPGGRTKRIEDLEVGDEVVCVDPITGTHQTTRVLRTRSVRRECVDVTVDGVSLTLTSDHPVYSPDDGSWAPAGDWALGRRRQLALSTGDALRVVSVTSYNAYAGIQQVYDITVEHPLHNFIANGVLVHNKDPLPRCISDGTCRYCPDGGVELCPVDGGP